VYHNHLLSCVLLEVTNDGCQNQREIKQNLPVGLHHLTSPFLSQTQSGTKMKEGEKNINIT
jgi:hypothetical protein